MRTVDFRFLTILVVSVLVIGGACHALHEYQLTRQKDVYIREADRVCSEGKPESAVDYLKSYLRVAPEDTEQRLRLARILRDLRVPGQAQSYYTQVLQGAEYEQFDPVERAMIRYERATVAMQLGLFEIAKDDLNGVLEQMASEEYRNAVEESANADSDSAVASDEGEASTHLADRKYGAERIELNRADAHELLGICLIQLEKYAESKNQFELAIDSDRARLGSYVASARLSAELIQPEMPDDAVRMPDDAVRTLGDMVSNNVDNPNAYVLRGQFFLDPVRDEAFKTAVLEQELCEAQRQHEESADVGEWGDDSPIANIVDAGAGNSEANVNRTPEEDEKEAAEEAVLWWALSDARSALQLLDVADELEESGTTGEVSIGDSGDSELTDVAAETDSELAALLLAMRAAHSLGLSDEAVELAIRINEADSTLALAYAVRAEIEIDQQHEVEAALILDEGITKCEDDAYLLWLLANLQIQQQKIVDAEAVVAEMEGKPELAPYRKLLTGRIHVAKNEWTEATDVLEDVQGALPAGSTMELEAKYWLAFSYQELGESDKAERVCDEALVLDRNSPAANQLRGALYLARGDFEKAIQHFNRGGAGSRARAARLSLERTVSALWAAGRREEAVDFLARVRADLNGRVGEFTERRGEFDPVMKSILQLQSRVHEELEELVEAERLLDEATELYPDDEEVSIAHVGFSLRQGDFDGARELLDAAESQFGDSVRLRAVRAQSATAAAVVDGIGPGNELDQLIGELKSIAEPPETWTDEKGAELRASIGLYAAQTLQRFLSTAADRRQALELAEVQLRQAAELAPTDPSVRLLLFDLALARNQVGRVDVPEGEVFTPDPEDWDSAKDLMKDMLGELEEILEDGDAYLSYGEAIKLALHAELEENSGLYDEALAHLQQAKLDRPQWDRIPTLEGRIQLVRENRVAAADAFVRAFELGMRNTDLIGVTLGLLYEQGRYTDAARLVGTLSDPGAAPVADAVPDLAQRAYDLSRRTEDSSLSDWAFSSLSSRIADSQIAGDHLLLALMLRKRGQMEQAEAQFRQAVDLGPSDPANWLALILHFIAMGQGHEAREALVAADASIAEDQRLLAMARAYEILAEFSEAQNDLEQAEQDMATARRHYQDVLVIPEETDPPEDFDSRLKAVADFHLRQQDLGEAERWLTELMEQPDVTAENLRWARRNLGVILLARGSYANLQDALALVKQNLSATDGVTVVEQWSDQRLQGLIYSRWPTREHREDAIQLYEELIDKSQIVSPADRVALAELHLAERAYNRNLADRSGGTNQAGYERAAVRHLLAAIDLLGRVADDTSQRAGQTGEMSEEQARHVALYAETLLANDQVGRAAQQARLLSRYLPDRGAMLNAEIAFRREEHDTVRQILEQYLNGVSAEVARKTVPVVAARLEDFADRSKPSDENSADEADISPEYLAAAEALFTAHGTAVPEQSLVLAGFLARQDRISEAVEMIERNWTANSDAALASAATFVLQNVREDEGSLARLNGLLDQAVGERPESVEIKLVTADVSAWRKDVTRAITLYQELLDQNPDDVVAGNNLAFLLATEKRDPQKALQLIDHAIALQGRVPALLDTRAVVLLSHGQHERALDDLNEAEHQFPSASYQMRRAQILLDWGRVAPSTAAYQNAISMGYSIEEDAHPLERDEMERVSASLR